MASERLEPSEGQESVWDYPRPPRLESCSDRVRVVVEDEVVADSSQAYRVLETSHPPTYYIPPDDVRCELLQESSPASLCEWKGKAKYFTLRLKNRTIVNAAWCYPTPTGGFSKIAGYLAFYPSKVDACFVDNEQVVPQEGDFYGGWITSKVIGPFKGGPSTRGW